MKTPSLLSLFLRPWLLLAIPAAAMLFHVDGWAWQASDFLVAWILLAGTGIAYHTVAQRMVTARSRFATGLAVSGGLALVWINGAVGLIGSENNPANRLYAIVIATGVIGAALSRFRPEGLARTLFVMAAVQWLVPVVAWLRWPADFAPGVGPVFGLNFGFVVLFALAGWLFRPVTPADPSPTRAARTA